MSPAAAGVLDVFAVAGDEVHVEVRHRLSCGFAAVHADVEAVGVMSREDRLAGDRQGGGELDVLFPRGVEQLATRRVRDEEGVAFADGVGVPEAEDVGASVEDARGDRSRRRGRIVLSSDAPW